jgi:hypothetical protein
MREAMMNRYRTLFPVLLGLLCVGVAAAAGGASGGDGAAEEKKQTEAAEEEAGVFRSEDEPVQVTVPSGEWEKLTSEDLQRGSPGGCLPAAGPRPGLLVVIRKPEKRVLGTVSRLPRDFLMRNEDDLRSFLDRMEEEIVKRGGEGTEVLSAELTRRDGVFVHRMEFRAQQQRGPGGCAAMSPSKGQAPEMHYVVRDYFVRPQGEKARIYRVGTTAPAESFDEYAEDLETFGESFQFTGDRAESFFEPGASEDQLPTVPEPGGGCGAFESPGLLVFAAVIVVFWWWFRRRMRAGEEQETGEAGAQGRGE